MINKNDLRYIKTEEAIRNTYRKISKKKKKPVSVAELCTTARINKSTFYMHYGNMEELRNSIGREDIHNLMQNAPNLHCLFNDEKVFVLSLFRFVMSHAQDIALLVPDKNTVVDMIEQEILDIYISPETEKKLECKIRFCIGGAMRMVASSQDKNTLEALTDIIQKVLVD